MLAAIKDGMMHPRTEKIVNAFMNNWIRAPGLNIVGFIFYAAIRNGRSTMPPLAALTLAALISFNGNYYSARVVASAGANKWRPS